MLEGSKALWEVTLLERTRPPSEECVCHTLRKMANGDRQECLGIVLVGEDVLETFLPYLAGCVYLGKEMEIACWWLYGSGCLNYGNLTGHRVPQTIQNFI